MRLSVTLDYFGKTINHKTQKINTYTEIDMLILREKSFDQSTRSTIKFICESRRNIILSSY